MALVYKEPIKVVCVKTKNSKKLIKGAIYSATSISTNTKNSEDRHIRVSAGDYSLECFTHLNGKTLKDEPDFHIEWKPTLNSDKNYKNQCVRCRYSSGKTLKNGEIYYVEEQKTKKLYKWNGTPYNHIELKIRGIRNWVSSNNFEEMHITEQRKIKLKNMKGEKVKTGESTRKFLLYTEKEKICILFQLLNSSLFDINNTEFVEKIDISKLILNKGKQYNVIDEDIKPFLNSVKPLLISYDLIW